MTNQKKKKVTIKRFFRRGPGGRLSFKPHLLANEILKKEILLSDPKTGLLYYWNGKFFEELAGDYVKRWIFDLLGLEATKNRVEDVYYQIKVKCALEPGRALDDHHELIPIKNGMLDFEGFKLLPHDPKYYSTFIVDVEFNPNCEQRCERWLQFLEETIQTPEAIMQLQEFFGYCLTKDTRYGKCLLALGPGADGKSVTLNVLRNVVGSRNCSAVSFEDLEDQFYRSCIFGKLLNISTEVGRRTMKAPIFKAVVTGDVVSGAFKFQTPFAFRPYVKLAFAANRLPRVADNSDGFYRRLLPIRFKKQFLGQDADPRLIDKLLSEIDEIFVWALYGLRRLRQQDGFTECDETMEIIQGYQRLNNPVVCFIEDKCMVGKNHVTTKNLIYDHYRKFCHENGCLPLGRESFFVELNAALSNLKRCQRRIDGRRVWNIQGIGLKDVG